MPFDKSRAVASREGPFRTSSCGVDARMAVEHAGSGRDAGRLAMPRRTAGDLPTIVG